MYPNLPAALRIACFYYFTSLRAVSANALSPSEYLKLVGSSSPAGVWSLNAGDISTTSWNLKQSDTNGKSLLGSFDAPTYNRFIPDRRRQTNVPWGAKTALNTNPADAPNTGVVRSYNFTIARSTLAPDGVERPVMLINGHFPGPNIEANWGDTISVTVHNNLDNEGTSLHWHGILQTSTNFNDGVPGVTQCPIAPGQSYTYTFWANSYGTTWYHAHYSAQYTAGLYGAMLIHGPTDNAPYDIDLGPVLLTDYYYQDYYSTVQEVMGTDASKIAPASNNNLINGKGIANCTLIGRNCTPNAGLATFRFETGKTHRLRLINAGVEAIQKFSIDNHVLAVTAVDFVPIVPYQTDVVTLAVGQRVDVLVKAVANSTDSALMRSTISQCSKTKQPNGLAVVYYPDADISQLPTGSAQIDTSDPCAEESILQHVPYFKVAPKSQPESTYEMDITVGQNSTGHLLWSVNNSTFWADYNAPLLPLIQSGEAPASLPAEWNLVDFGSAKSVQMVINNRSPVAHPMHIHGYDMYVLAAGGSSPNSTTQAFWDGSITNPQNPMRRDTYLLQPNGFLVIQIDSLNPGVWPFHCHIAWHVSGGLYVKFLTQKPSIPSTRSPPGLDGLCKSWGSFSNSSYVDQIDSGL